MMTSKAKEIGMYNTNFSNASEINDPDNYSTARDILIMSDYLIEIFLATILILQKRIYGIEPAVTITQGNRNPLLYKKWALMALKLDT